MEDKIISMKGLCMLVTDEGVGFFDDIQKKQKNHESDLSMLNQLFDGKGNRMTLAQNKECIVLPNSTSISIGVQEESFCEALALPSLFSVYQLSKLVKYQKSNRRNISGLQL